MLLAVICLTVPLEAAAYIPYKTPYLLGDVDKNGAVTAADALLALPCANSFFANITFKYTSGKI